MPSRAAHLIAFLSIVLISVSCHVYVYRQLRSLIKRDFPRRQDRLLFIAKCLFIYFDLPFVYMFFWRHISFDATLLTQFLMYPFAMWQVLMLVWSAILIPIGLLRSRLVKRASKLVMKPIVRLGRRFFRPRKQPFPDLLPATEEI